MSKSVFNSSKWTIQKKKLAVLVPCRDMIHSAFSKCLIELVKFNTANNIDTHVVYDSSTVLLTQRENLAMEAQAIDAEYMLWLDRDMTFPPTTAVRLMAHNEDVVVANYVKRQPPFKGVAYKKIGEWQRPLSLAPQSELVTIEGIGMGCFMMKTSILNQIPQPWFEFTWSPESKDNLGEDMNFCKKINSLGYEIKVDTQLTLELRHLGQWAFGPELVK